MRYAEATMKPLLLCLLLTLPAAAQRKLWTWTPPNQDADVSHTVLAYSALPSGAAALIYAEVDFSPPERGAFAYRAVLISPKGIALQSAVLTPPAGYDSALNFNPNLHPKWLVVGTSKTDATLTDGEQVIRFSLKGKVAAIAAQTVGPIDERGAFAMPSGAGSLPSYLKFERAFAGNVVASLPGESFTVPSYRLTSVELWSLK